MAFDALKSAGLPFDLIRSQDIQSGVLRDYEMLFVPGGWASNKIKSLGDTGTGEIQTFVHEGGTYLGFCGGAGLATLDGIGLLQIKRVPTRNRVPSFSGPVRLDLANHSIWNGISDPVFHAWWPSQFLIEDININILATYNEALAGSYSSDLDVIKQAGNWQQVEQAYGINLDPARLYGQPAVVEGCYGRGKVILSLIHFDTPDDPNGRLVLKNIWQELSGAQQRKRGSAEVRKQKIKSEIIEHVGASAADLIHFGICNGLWSWRNSMLLQWKRGIRGLEYCNLYMMIEALIENLSHKTDYIQQLDEIRLLLATFITKSEKLLSLERDALKNGKRITYEKSDNPEIIQLRTELFANSKSYGGEFKVLIDKIAAVLYDRLRNY